ncbi:MAG: PspA/IM30 family protein [Armatimonadetes bacterium]|nr:PspA/IM30 family protein [Armatimonadota bacterium]
MFERIKKLIKGFLSMFISDLEAAHPRALLEAEITALHEAVANYNTNLAKQAALVERLRGQTEKTRKELDRYTARATAVYQAQQMEEAGRLALMVKTLKQDLTDQQTQLGQADELYKNLTRQRDVYVREAQKRIENIKQKMTKAEIAESQADLAEIATTTAFDLAGSGATLQRIEEKLDERVAQATGKARVAADQAGTGDWATKAEEESALEAQALAEFATAMGMAPPVQAQAPAPAAPEPQERERDLGPAQSA